ncbi:MAG: hypothetical protein GVY13_07905 [Alphaproteobacteria bacterium]|jgi:hypothetical protein|nr:hypothetical protein [Alphaproteobacteria bacterium]
MDRASGRAIIKAVKARELPAHLRPGIEDDAEVLISIHRITENGFTEAFEQEVLEAERQVADCEAMDMKAFLAELHEMIEEDENKTV